MKCPIHYGNPKGGGANFYCRLKDSRCAKVYPLVLHQGINADTNGQYAGSGRGALIALGR
jgi:hypothetical protein